MTRLFKDCGFTSKDVPFMGAIELGSLAKQQNLVGRVNTSLADLVKIILKRYLPKDETIRVSLAWDDIKLPQTHLEYAQLDVYACWALRESLMDATTSDYATSSTPVGTPVKLLSRDNSSVVAVGFISPERPAKFKGVRVTNTRVLVNVTSVNQPGYLVRSDLVLPHEELALSQLATAIPFTLLCNAKDVRIMKNSESPHEKSTAKPPLPPHPYSSEPGCFNPYSNTESNETDHGSVEIQEEDWNWTHTTPVDSNQEQSADGSSLDLRTKENLNIALNEVASISTSNSYEDTAIRSRVIGDLWHLMHQFRIPVHHGLRRPFSRALRDAIFIPDPGDKATVEVVLKKKNLTWEQMLLWNSDWLWRRVRRFVPRPDVLLPRVSKVFEVFGPLKDATTGEPLFNKASIQKAKNVLENIRLGYYSDPPGIKLYILQREDKHGLSLYRCMRGTNGIEGGIHQNIIRRFGSFCASPRFAVNLLREYCLTHNLRVSTFPISNKTQTQMNTGWNLQSDWTGVSWIT